MNTEQQQYCLEVLRFRKALNLTSISDPDEFHRRFVAPSLALAAWLPERGRLLDIGSGMGIPGIPLLIHNPNLYGVLVERRKKRAEFLRHVIRTLKLSGEVHDADINALPSLGVDACVARAVTNQEHLLTMCGRHANPDSVVVIPVPRESQQVRGLKDWVLEDEQRIEAFPDQLVRCYQFRGTHEGGFT